LQQKEKLRSQSQPEEEEQDERKKSDHTFFFFCFQNFCVVVTVPKGRLFGLVGNITVEIDVNRVTVALHRSQSGCVQLVFLSLSLCGRPAIA
jgi:hypothetical protein